MEDNQPQGREAITTSGTPNPASFFAEWNSTEKCFSYYDKTAKVDVLLPLPFTFIPLAIATSVKGYNHKQLTKYQSNEVNNLQTDVMTINSYHNTTKQRAVVASGLYAEIKPFCEANGIKYTQSVYVAVKNAQGQLVLANLQINASGLKSWIDFQKVNDISKVAVQVKSFTNEKNGSVNFTSPVYSAIKIAPATDQAAAVLQKQVKAYLAEYFAKHASGTPAPVQHTQPAAQAPLPSLHEQKHAVTQPAANTQKIEPSRDVITNMGDDDFTEPPF